MPTAPPTGTYLPPPKSLHFTTDPSECAGHIPPGLFVSFICGQAIRNGDLILVWDWAPEANCPQTATCPHSADGYRVYPRGRNANTLVAVSTQDQGTDWTEAGIKPNASPARCYAVKAYKGDVESDQSNIICVGSARLGSQVVDLPLTEWFTSWHYDCSAQLAHVFSRRFTTMVGYRNFHPPSDPECGDSESQWARAGMLFDPAQARRKDIWKATLHLKVKYTSYAADSEGQPSPQRSDASCAVSIGAGTGRWYLHYDKWIDANFFADLTNAGEFDVDVTDQVRQWAGTGPNYGLVLRGNPDREQDRVANGICITSFEDPTLTVEYSQ